MKAKVARWSLTGDMGGNTTGGLNFESSTYISTYLPTYLPTSYQCNIFYHTEH